MTDFFNDSLDGVFGLGSGSVGPKPLPTESSYVALREAVPVFAERCPKCRGTGNWTSYSGYTSAKCFACKGKGQKVFKTSSAVRSAAKVNAVAKKVSVVEGNLEAYAAANPEAYAWMNKKASSFEFANNMLVAVGKFGSLTPGQAGAVAKCVARDVAYEAEKAQPKAAKSAVDCSALEAAFAASGSKAKMMVAGLKFSKAPATGKNAGSLYVKMDGMYLGKITGGEFFGTYNMDPELVAKVAEVGADPKGAVVSYSKMTAAKLAAAEAIGEVLSLPCGCCGITLTDPVSVQRGIGPVCAAKWNF